MRSDPTFKGMAAELAISLEHSDLALDLEKARRIAGEAEYGRLIRQAQMLQQSAIARSRRLVDVLNLHQPHRGKCEECRKPYPCPTVLAAEDLPS